MYGGGVEAFYPKTPQPQIPGSPTPPVHTEKSITTAVKALKAVCIGEPKTLARSKSKNKTLAVGEYVHSEVTRIQSGLRTRNHDETMREILKVLAENQLLQ